MRLSRERWYNTDGQRELSQRVRVESGGMRRVIALSVLLALVLMCMLQLQEKDKYEPVFQAIGLAPITKPASSPRSGLIDDDLPASELEKETPAEFSALRIWTALLSTASKDELNKICIFLFSDPTTESQATLPDVWLAKVDDVLNAWSDAVKSQDLSDNSDLSSFISKWEKFRSNPTEPLDDSQDAAESYSFFRLFKLAVDKKLLTGIVDASSWQSTETLPFARTLQRGSAAKLILDEVNPTEASSFVSSLPLVELPLLTKQPEVVRGRLVRVRGYVVRADKKPVTKLTRLGAASYHVLWLKPEQASNVPFCVYLCEENEDADCPLPVDEENIVELAAIPLKRLAYASESGIQVAPVLVGAGFRLAAETAVKTDVVSAFAARLRQQDPMLLPTRSVREAFAEPWLSPSERIAKRQVVESLVLAPLREFNQQATSLDTIRNGDLEADVLRSVVAIVNGLERTAKVGIDPALLGNDIPNGSFASASGLVNKVDSIPLPSELAEGVGFKQLYRLQVLPDSNESDRNTPDKTNTLFVPSVPDSWKGKSETRQYLQFQGLRIHQGGNDEFWCADRISWVIPADLPSDELDDLSPRIAPELLPLVKVGWDFSWLDLIRSRQKAAIQDDESEAFYTFIAAAAKDETVTRGKMSSVPECLSDPDAKIGFPIRGSVRTVRITRIAVTDARTAKLLGSSQYFEINTLADIGDGTIRLVGSNKENTILFVGEFPLTIVCRDLPSQLLPRETVGDVQNVVDGSESWYISTPLKFEGRFYKLWAYNSKQTDAQVDGDARQVAPLVMASHLTVIDEIGDAASRNIVNMSFTIIGIIVITAFAIARFMAYQNSARKNARTKI